MVRSDASKAQQKVARAQQKNKRKAECKAEDSAYARVAAGFFRASSTTSCVTNREAMDGMGMESLLPEAENASGGADGLTHRPAVEGSAAVEQEIALDALLAAQVAEKLEGRHAGTAGGAAGAADADAAQRRMQAGAMMT